MPLMTKSFNKNVLFLDIDGVLNTVNSMMNGVHIMSDNVIMIRDLCMSTNTDIVISSSWRETYSLDTIKAILCNTGLNFHNVKIIGVTPVIGFRGDEINAWLENNPVDRFVIIDDATDFHKKQKKFIVKTVVEIGLTKDHIEQARLILMNI